MTGMPVSVCRLSASGIILPPTPFHDVTLMTIPSGTQALGATMKATFVSRVSRALCFLALVTAAYGQATQTKPFEPQVGQAGKDVVWVPTPQTLVDKMLEISKTTPQDYLMDLGSGDGRTV